MESLNLISEETKKAIDEISNFCRTESVSVTIQNNDQYSSAGELIKTLKKYEKDVEAHYRTAKDPIVKDGRVIDGYFKPVLDRVKACVSTLNTSLWQWQRKIEEGKRRLQIEADRKAAEEAAKLKAQAEAASAKADEYRGKCREDLAEKWDGKSMDKSMQAETVVAAPVANVPEAPKITGLSMRETWKGKVIDKKALMAWCVQSGMINLFDISESALNAQARACKGEMAIPGVEWYTTVTTAGRG
jgi:hypothetical protein